MRAKIRRRNRRELQPSSAGSTLRGYAFWGDFDYDQITGIVSLTYDVASVELVSPLGIGIPAAARDDINGIQMHAEVDGVVVGPLVITLLNEFSISFVVGSATASVRVWTPGNDPLMVTANGLINAPSNFDWQT